jgi:Profilin
VQSFENHDHVFAEGFKVNGTKYTCIRSDESTLMGKKVSVS